MMKNSLILFFFFKKQLFYDCFKDDNVFGMSVILSKKHPKLFVYSHVSYKSTTIISEPDSKNMS